jgi:hopanoid C-3 methylase
MICEPLELEYVAAGVPECEVRIHDMLVSDDLDGVVEDFRPHVVGTGCYINNVREALAVCARVKEMDPEIITVMGGVHAVFNPKDFEFEYIDYIVQGEGITTFREIIKSIINRSNPESILGIGYRTVDGFHYTARRPFPADVNEFPLPRRDLLNNVRVKYFYVQWKPLAIMRTSWGCPFQCTFCYNRHLTDDRYYARSPESVVAEMETIESKHIFIIDDTFLINRNRLEKIYQLIKKKKLKKEFLAYGRTDFIAHNRDILIKWRDIGLKMIRVGVESVTDEELNSYNKKNTIENNDRALEIGRDLGIDISASFLLPPHYDASDFRKVAEYIKKNRLVYIFLNPLTPLPGTGLYDTYKDQLIAPHTSCYPLWDFQHCVLKPTRMSLKSFYRRMNLLYLATYNPLRLRKTERRPQLSPFSIEALKLYKNLIKTYYEMLFAYRHHERVITGGKEWKLPSNR